MTKLHLRTSVKLTMVQSPTRAGAKRQGNSLSPSASSARLPSWPSSFKADREHQEQLGLDQFQVRRRPAAGEEAIQDILSHLELANKRSQDVMNTGRKMIRPLSSILRKLEVDALDGAPPPSKGSTLQKGSPFPSPVGEPVRKEGSRKKVAPVPSPIDEPVRKEGKPARRLPTLVHKMTQASKAAKPPKPPARHPSLTRTWTDPSLVPSLQRWKDGAEGKELLGEFRPVKLRW